MSAKGGGLLIAVIVVISSLLSGVISHYVAADRYASGIERLTAEGEGFRQQSDQSIVPEQRIVARPTPSWSGRMKLLMFSLFYPAVLGALLYDILLAGKRANWLGRLVASDRKLLIAGLLVLHFVFDFIFTQEVGGYSALVFGLDIAIVILLFVAYSGVHLHESEIPLNVGRIAISLSGTYLCFLLWEYLSRTELGFHSGLFSYELAAFILFFLVFILSRIVSLNPKWLVWLLVAATIAMAVIGSLILEKYHAANPAI